MNLAESHPLEVLHTVRHLKPVQIWSRVWKTRPSPPDSAVPARRPVTGTWVPAVPKEAGWLGGNRFRFLNQEREIRSWNDPGVPKLWLYNLHYFECPYEQLIARWIRENPWRQGNGWEPYPLSLRIVNWIKWEFAGNRLSPDAVGSLAAQAACLAGSIEWHLLANHLFANAKALLFAGCFLEGPAAEKCCSEGLRILEREIPEQILPDGGHFERSPMYHSLILEDVLDLVNLGRAYPGRIPASAVDAWSEAASRMSGWLDRMCHPDGEISFFNDAALKIAPAPQMLAKYATRLGIRQASVPLAESGYIRLQQGPAVLLFDAAPIGPDYQPGHAHADCLSFELSNGARRLVVNSGVSTYENSAERRLQRGTAAHNTVRINGLDQSEVWSAFRVARRARPFDIQTDHRTYAEASHDGYHRVRKDLTHRRRVEFAGDRVVVTDWLEGRGRYDAEIFFHLYPGADVRIDLDPQFQVSVEDTRYYPEFNVAVPNQTVVGRRSGSGPVRFTTHILLDGHSLHS